MIKQEEVFKIGRLGRTHGVKGEITLHFDDDIFDRVDADYLVLEIDGILVPFFMEEYRFRSDSVALIKFCDIDTQQRAAELTGCDVYFPRTLADSEGDTPSLASLVGFRIVRVADGLAVGSNNPVGTNSPVGTNCLVGTIVAIDDSTANILFELEDGRLIPANDDLITDINTQERTITMTLPEGLLTL